MDTRSTIQRLHAAGVPVIPVTGATLDEVAPIAADLGLQTATIIEASGAIARWTGTGWEVDARGPSADTLLDVIREVEDRSGASLLVYSASSETATPSRFSEPFVLESGDLDAVRRAAAAIGYTVRRGGQFLHLCRESDEPPRLCDELRCDVAIVVAEAGGEV